MTCHNTTQAIAEQSLHVFYTYAVLPQFGINRTDVLWNTCERLEGGESLHNFEAHGRDYTLIYEDYDGLGRNKAFVQDCVVGVGQTYELVSPVAESTTAPSFDGFRLRAPSQHSPNITGTFTLVMLRKAT